MIVQVRMGKVDSPLWPRVLHLLNIGNRYQEHERRFNETIYYRAAFDVERAESCETLIKLLQLGRQLRADMKYFALAAGDQPIKPHLNILRVLICYHNKRSLNPKASCWSIGLRQTCNPYIYPIHSVEVPVDHIDVTLLPCRFMRLPNHSLDQEEFEGFVDLQAEQKGIYVCGHYRQYTWRRELEAGRLFLKEKIEGSERAAITIDVRGFAIILQLDPPRPNEIADCDQSAASAQANWPI